MEFLALNRKRVIRLRGANVPFGNSRGAGREGRFFFSVTENGRVSHGGRSLSKHKL